MLIDLEQLAEMKYELTQLGAVASDLSSKNTEYFQELFNSTEHLTELFKSTLPKDELEKVSKHADAIAAHVKQIDVMMGGMMDSLPGADLLSDSLNTLSDKFDGLSTNIKNDQSGKSVGGIKKKDDKKKTNGSISNYFSRELGQVSSKLGTLLSSLKVPMIGGAMAGLIGIIAYGAMERQRLQAESGEVSDILVIAADSHLKKLKVKAVSWASSFQETMQRFYGISKQEIQSILSEFTSGGVRIGEWSQRADKDLGVVGKNMVSWSLGVDKLLNVAGGATAKKMVEYQQLYGMSLKESQMAYKNMLEGGTSTGLGYSRYLNSVQDASSETEKLGFNIASTADLMEGMQGHLDGLKIPKQMGSALLVKGVKGIASGLSGMSEGWTRAVAERMGMGRGVEGIQKYKESWMRMQKTKGNPESLKKFVNEVVSFSLDIFEGDEFRAKYLMSKELGMGTEGSYIAMEAWKKSKEAKDPSKSKEDQVSAKKSEDKLYKDLKGSLETEASKRTSWERDMNKWMKHISNIGMGLLGLLANTLGKLVLYFRLIPEYASTLFAKDGAAKRDRLSTFVEKTLGDSAESIKKIEKGFEGLGKAGMSLLGDALGPAMDTLKDSFTTPLPSMFDSTTEDREVHRPLSSGGSSSGVNIHAPATVQTVIIDGGGPSTAEITAPEYEAARRQAESQPFSPGAKAFKTGWLGERALQIVSYGVTESGDINLALVGECPRCGLSFDGGFSEEQYENSWNNADDLNGVDIIGVNTGLTGKVDLSKSGALDKVRNLSVTGARQRKIDAVKGGSGHLDPQLTGVLKEISQMFPGKPIKVYKSEGAGSGKHGTGEALDLSVPGVKSSELFRSLRDKGYGTKKGGLGYYPNQPFIHVDVRKGKASTWVDESKKKESAKYIKNANRWINENLYTSDSDQSGTFPG